tara:strand:+ start:99 stop:479 length:381 start_codon:yes stop_codon:yes gene_type:complete
MVKLKDLLTEWTDTSFKDLPKRWSKPVMKGREPDGLTEFERLGGKDNIKFGKVYTDIDRPPFKIDEKMSDDKRAFLMLRIYGDSWKINLGKVFSGINKGKPTLIKKGLKEIKLLNKKIEEMIEELI